MEEKREKILFTNISRLNVGFPQGEPQMSKTMKCGSYHFICRTGGCKQLMSCCWFLLLVNLDREQFLFICQGSQAHSKYVITFDIDKIHASILASTSLKTLENGQRGCFVPQKTLAHAYNLSNSRD
jgi:hypothetical protein